MLTFYNIHNVEDDSEYESGESDLDEWILEFEAFVETNNMDMTPYYDQFRCIEIVTSPGDSYSEGIVIFAPGAPPRKNQVTEIMIWIDNFERYEYLRKLTNDGGFHVDVNKKKFIQFTDNEKRVWKMRGLIQC